MPKLPKQRHDGQRLTTVVLSAVILLLIGLILIAVALRGVNGFDGIQTLLMLVGRR
jgi:hypothetical protein